jgi:hypothetical protein
MHLQRGADRHEQVSGLHHGHCPIEQSAVQRLAEEHRAGLQDPAADEARGISVAGPDPVQRRRDRPAVTAFDAYAFADRSVQLHDKDLGRTGTLMETVDVLCQQCAESPAPAELGEAAVGFVWFCVPSGMAKSPPP